MSGFSCTRTSNGTVIVRDPCTGLAASGRSLAGAYAELRRLLSTMEAA